MDELFADLIDLLFQSFLKHKDAKPLRDVLASNPSRFVPLLVPAGTPGTVRPGSPSTSTARLDLQFQAIKVHKSLGSIFLSFHITLKSDCLNLDGSVTFYSVLDHKHHREER